MAGVRRRNGKVTECWNTDAYGANERWSGLYQSHTWVLGVRPDGTAGALTVLVYLNGEWPTAKGTDGTPLRTGV